MEYGVSIRNKFAFLDDDASDPEEVLTKTTESKKDAPKKVSPVTAPAQPKPVEKEPAKAKDGSDRQAQRGGPNRSGQQQPKRFPPQDKHDQQDRTGQRNDRGAPRQFNNDRLPLRRSGDENAPPRDQRDGADRGPPRGYRKFEGQGRRYERKEGETNTTEGSGYRKGQDQRGGFQRRGGYGYQNRGERFNREGRRDGQEEQSTNAENLQSTPDHIDETKKTADNATENVEVTNVNGEDAPIIENSEEKDEEKANEEPAEPELVVKTLEEWRSENKKAEASQFNLRKPGEGADQKIYQKLMPIKKDTARKEKETEEEDHHGHKEKREKALTIDISFLNSKRSGGFDRGGYDRERPQYKRPTGEGGYRGSGGAGEGGGNRGTESGGYRGGDGSGYRASGDRGGVPPRGPPRGPPREGNNERGGYRGGGRFNGSGGQSRDAPVAGPSRRGPAPPGFNLETEQFPALGAKN